MYINLSCKLVYYTNCYHLQFLFEYSEIIEDSNNLSITVLLTEVFLLKKLNGYINCAFLP